MSGCLDFDTAQFLEYLGNYLSKSTSSSGFGKNNLLHLIVETKRFSLSKMHPSTTTKIELLPSVSTTSFENFVQSSVIDAASISFRHIFGVLRYRFSTIHDLPHERQLHISIKRFQVFWLMLIVRMMILVQYKDYLRSLLKMLFIDCDQ